MIVENVPLCEDHRLRKQVECLSAAGHRISVITMRSRGNGQYRTLPGVNLFEYPAPKQPSTLWGYLIEYALSFACAALLLCRLRLRTRVDVLQVCQPPDIYFPLCRLMRWSGARIVVDQRDLLPELFLARYERSSAAVLRGLHWLERRSQREADRVLCVNEYLRDRIVAAGAMPSKVSVIRNGPVLARVERAEADHRLRSPHRYLVCWVGKMGKQDRVDLLVRAAHTVVAELGRVDCGFIVIGDGECLEDLRDLTKALSVEPWVSFPGWLSEEDVFRYLASADLGVDTSLQAEVSPVKAMEYMAFGLPFVCFDLLETRRISVDAATLVPAGDFAELAAAIVELLDDAEKRDRLACVGRQRVRDELAWENQAARYLGAMESVVSGGSISRTRQHEERETQKSR